MSAADLHTLTGAYAAHALGPDEREEFERHLERCPACAQEVAEFIATLTRLGSAQAVPVAAEFKQRVMGALEAVRQEPPGEAPQLPGRRRGVLRRALPRFAPAACLALAIGAGCLAIQQHHRADQARATAAALQQQQGRITALLTAPDARTTSGKVTGSGVATVVWSQTQGAAGFLAAGLPPLAGGTTYQLWFDDDGTMRPAGLLPTASGALMLNGPLNAASGVGVTVEPAGGSPQPTGTPLVLLAFG
ncbi:anti-sigma factor domain-containing protein [Kitasatospora sp. NPDC096204]|uniref:anti-sigma factor n=1 Tax=Kitasatospora sp. NPDC096204 TaxID=3364094 RepID=UPI0037F51CD6